jgi:quercetin dioxygenase-like cupin family protein
MRVRNSGRMCLAICFIALAWLSGAVAGEGIESEIISRETLPGGKMEVITAFIRLHPGAELPRHTHHGDEFLYVLKGGSFQTPEGKTITFADEDTAHFPRDEPHAGFTVIGDTSLEAVTVHIVDVGKPLRVTVE